MFVHWSVALLGVSLLGLWHLPNPPPTIHLPPPANLHDISNLTQLTRHQVDRVGIRGGESIALLQGELVTGTLDGYLVGFDQELRIKWRVKCPPAPSGEPCRILGIRVAGTTLYGVDKSGRLFSFAGGIFDWLLTSDSPDIRRLAPGFFNDLVVVHDSIYITDSYPNDPAKKNQNMFQRFYSLAPEGRILCYNLTSRELRVLTEGLFIPNGIELQYDNRTLIVAEGNMYRILRVDMKSGEILGMFGMGTLGAVDNIRRSMDGGFWVGVSTGRSSENGLPDMLAKYPRVRRLLTQHPIFGHLLVMNMKYAAEYPRFYKTDREGTVVRAVFGDRNITDTNAMSEVLETGGYLFVGAPFSDSVLRIML